MLTEKGGTTRVGNVIPAMFWGDSRCRGFGSSNPTATGWAGLLSAELPPYYTTQINGVDGDTLFAHSGDAGKRATTTAAIAALVAGAPKSVLIFQYDYNDWHNGALASDFGTWYTAQLASFATIPGLNTVVFSSIDYAAYATANGVGSTMSDFLAQEVAAVAANSATSVLLAGKPMLTYAPTPYYFDVVHPNDAGYRTICNAIAPKMPTF